MKIDLKYLAQEIEINGEKFTPMIELLKVADDEAIISTVDIRDFSPLKGVYFSCLYNTIGGDVFEFEYQDGYGFNMFNVSGGNIGKTWLPNQVQLWEKLVEWGFNF